MTGLRGRPGRPIVSLTVALGAALALTGGAALAQGQPATSSSRPAGAGVNAAAIQTASPIKHVVVIIGENHTFDNVFATYKPPAGQKVRNLLSEGIVTACGAPGPNVSASTQQTATTSGSYTLNPTRTGAYVTLPQPNTNSVSPACDGQPNNQPDTRFPSNLANAPYQITKYVPYFDAHGAYASKGTCEFIGAFVGDPLHRFTARRSATCSTCSTSVTRRRRSRRRTWPAPNGRRQM